jgi:hypothetical protein
MTAIYQRSTRENATTSRVSILLPNCTVTDRDLQFRESSIVVDDETVAAFLRHGSDSSALPVRSAGSPHFAPSGLGQRIPFILERLHLALELILESLFARQLELVSTREDLPALIV